MPDIEAGKAAHNLDRETAAVQALRAQFAEEIADDEDMNIDLIEGETSFLEMIDLVYEASQQDDERLEGIKRRKEELSIREKRFKARRDRLKGIIEQAMTVADLKKIERPVATFSISKRQPKVEVVEEDRIPPEYFVRPDPRVDLNALKKSDPVQNLIAAMKAVRAAEDGAKNALPIEEALEAQAKAESELAEAIPGLTVEAVADSLTVRKA